MTSIKEDKRTQRTKKAIKRAFASLAAHKEIQHITISEIAQNAGINRKTFYTHYSSVKELVDEIADELIAIYSNIMDEIDLAVEHYNPCKAFERMTEAINDDPDYYRHLLKANGNSRFLVRATDTLRTKIINTLTRRTGASVDRITTAVEFIAAGTVAVYQEWYNSDRTRSFEELSKTIAQMSINCFNTICYGV